MDEFAFNFLGVVVDDSAIPEEVEDENEGQGQGQGQAEGQAQREAQGQEQGNDQTQNEAGPDTTTKKTRGLRSGIFRAANLQDKLLEK